ncbi:putative ABC-type xenobiotic transporter [Helianthus anomalus]
MVGLSLSYALNLTGTQVFLTRWYCSLANYIISVERVKQFMHIPTEPPAVVVNNRPPSSWPSEGRINFEDLKAMSFMFKIVEFSPLCFHIIHVLSFRRNSVSFFSEIWSYALYMRAFLSIQR